MPTDVRLELCTPLPSVLPLRTDTSLILYTLPLARSKLSELVQLSVELIQLIVLLVVPFSVIPPPSAVTSVGDATLPSRDD